MTDKKRMKLCKAFKVGQASHRHIAHNDDRDDDLICRESQNERHQNIAVQPQRSGKRVQKPRALREKADAADLNVGEQPDHKTRRGGYDDGAAQDEQRSVEDGADDYPADLRAAVGGKLQIKRRRHPF